MRDRGEEGDDREERERVSEREEGCVVDLRERRRK